MANRSNSGQVSDWGHNVVVDRATTATAGYFLKADQTQPSSVTFGPEGSPTVRTSTAYAIPGSIWVSGGTTASWDPARLWVGSFFVPRTPITVTGLQCRYSVAGSAGSVVVMGVFEIPAQFSGSVTPVVTGSIAADAAAGIKSATGLSTQLTVGKLYGLGLTHNSTANMTFIYRGHSPNYGDPRVDINDMVNRLITSAGGYTTTQLTNLTAVAVSTTSTSAPGDFSLVMMSWTD